MNLNAVETKIVVAGEPCDFVYMKLDQYVTAHHTFEIAVNYRHHKQNVWAITPDDIFRETLGKPVGIQMKHRESGAVNEFSGIVTDIEAVGIDGDQGTIILRGGSPTVLLDRNPMMDSFMDYTLSAMVAETIGKTAVPMSLSNKPKSNDIIPYIGRYDETTWAFLSRILAAYGEWFYYDGRKLIVGNPLNQDECRVTFDTELRDVKTVAGMNNLNTRYFYHHIEDKKYYEEKSGTIGNANLPMKAAKMASDPMYPTPHKRPVGREILGEGDMTGMVRTKQSREYTKCSVFSATCNTCGIHIGGVATIHLPKAKGVRFIDLGSFRVLEIHHSVNKEGNYFNTFKGITALTETLPDDHIVMPHAFSEPAIVIDNADPKNKGRVKVRFAWQDEPYTTNWIQVQTPDAGSSGAVPKNRGFFFIPEIGDQVLVGFLHGDPSRPYVAGSLYHRDITKGAEPDNNVKTITTRSGITVIFDDGENKGSITIKDPSGNVTKHDGNGNISITAPNTVSVTCTDFKVNASNSITMDAKPGKNGGKGTIDVTAHKTMSFKTETDSFSVESQSKDISLKAKTNFTASSETASMKLQAARDVKMESSDTKINASSTIRVKSPDTDVI
jgi:uncharacterized protein involved in type VI secretion and phage assembly